MEIIESEKYEDLAAEFQYEMIKILNETLKKHKISEEDRKAICGDFTFGLSMLLDQGKILDTIPIVTFSHEDKLYMKTEEFEFHEYAFGNVDEVFDNDKLK